jgi:hypothetical protein
MKQSESISELATALSIAQSQIGGAVRSSTNPFFKSSYADLGDVIKAIKEPLAANGLSMIQMPITNLIEKSVGVSTRIIHSSGEWIEGEFFLPLTKFDSQAVGSALSYSRRYGITSILMIPQTDDDANAASMKVDQTKVQAKSDQRKQLHDQALAAHQSSVDQIKEYLAEQTQSGIDMAKECLAELPESDQQALWLAPSKGGCFTTQERHLIKVGLQ